MMNGTNLSDTDRLSQQIDSLKKRVAHLERPGLMTWGNLSVPPSPSIPISTTEPTDAEMLPNTLRIWRDTDDLRFKVKYLDGTIKTGNINLNNILDGGDLT